MAHPSETLAMLVVAFVAAIAFLLALIAYRAKIRTDNRALLFLVGAFALLAVKGILVAVALPTHIIGHENLELVSALFDLGVVALIAWPLLRR